MTVAGLLGCGGSEQRTMAAVEAARAFACGRGPQQVAAEQMGTEARGTLNSSDVTKLASDNFVFAACNASMQPPRVMH